MIINCNYSFSNCKSSMLISLAFLLRNNMEYNMNRRKKSLGGGGGQKLSGVETCNIDIIAYVNATSNLAAIEHQQVCVNHVN